MANSWPTSAYSSLYDLLSTFGASQTKEGLAAFRTYLNDKAGDKVRVFVDTGAEGQRASANLVRRLAAAADAKPAGGFAYAHEIELCYRDDAVATQLESWLLPDAGWSDGSGTLGDATLKLLKLPADKGPDDAVKVAFTAGAAKPDKLAADLKANYLLLLQPFRSTAAQQIQFDTTSLPAIDLSQQTILGKSSFARRAYAQSAPDLSGDGAWEPFTSGTGAPAERAKVLQWLTGDAQLKKVDLVPLSGIRTDRAQAGGLAAPAGQRIAMAVASFLVSQNTGDHAKNAKPIVLVNLDDYDPKARAGLDASAIAALLDGGPTAYEKLFLPKVEGGNEIDTSDPSAPVRSYAARKAYLERLKAGSGADGRARFLFPSGSAPVSLSRLKSEVDDLGANDVLFVQLGPVVQPVYAYTLSRAGLPSVFADTASANLALNLGKPYLFPAPPSATGVRYPTVDLGDVGAGAAASRLQRAANQLQIDLDAVRTKQGKSVWASEATAPPSVLGRTIAELRDAAAAQSKDTGGDEANGVPTPAPAGPNGGEPASDDGAAMLAYFKSVADFYAKAENDKLNLGANYLNYVIEGREGGDALTLKELLDNLQDALKDGKINLAQAQLYKNGVLAKLIDKLADAVLGDAKNALELHDATVTPKKDGDDLKSVTVAGKTEIDALKLDVDLVFTAPEKTVQGDLTLTASHEEWSIPEVPWIVFKKPFMALTVPNGKLPTAGAIGGKLEAGDEFTFKLQVTGEKKTWLFQAEAEDKALSLERIYALAGGVNLVQQLPTPFNAIAAFGLKAFELQYDYDAKQIAYMSFDLRTSQAVELFAGIELSSFTVETVIEKPGAKDRSERSITADMTGIFQIDDASGQAALLAAPGLEGDSDGDADGEGDGDPAVIKLAAKVPELTFSGGLETGELTIQGLIRKFVPDVTLPDQLGQPTITGFGFDYAYPTGALSASMDMGLQFKFPTEDKPLFTVEKLGFNLDRKDGKTSGGLTGHLELLKTDTDSLPLDVSATYATGEGWVFTAAQTGGAVPLVKLIKDYLGIDGAGAADDLTVSDLSLTLHTKDRQWQFQGKTGEPWEIPFIPEISARAEVLVGYQPKSDEGGGGGEDGGDNAILVRAPGVGQRGRAGLVHRLEGPPAERPHALLALTGTDESGLHAKVSLFLLFENIKLTIFADVGSKAATYGMVWHFGDLVLNATIEHKVPESHEVSRATWRALQSGEPAQKAWIATISLGEKTTLGDMVELLIGWATGSKFGLSAPWDLLNKIDLSHFKIKWDFTNKTVSFEVEIGPIELGIATIKAIEISYESGGGQRKVMVTLVGSFLWKTDEELRAFADERVQLRQDPDGTATLWDASQAPSPWNAAKPEETPAPPGGGNKYVDLRLLALGQHIGISGLETADSVEKVVETLRSLDNAGGDEIPIGGEGQPYFEPNNGWLVAADFGILKVPKKDNGGGGGGKAGALATLEPGGAPTGDPGRGVLTAAEGEGGDEYFISLSIVFNDPQIYALRIALAGPAAKILKGLDFEIMYRQVSDTLGVYSAEITLPDAMRRIRAGVYTVIMPSFGIEVYTNGDFKLDIGFPYNEDFSRSFTIEAIVYPGIPLLGSAGFYFGMLSGESSTQVPKAPEKGWFNPVIVAGFGAQFGVGKSIQAGILSAGFSITAVGILQGVIAKWHAYSGQEPAFSNQIQDSYFFKITGTVGIIGKLYGHINFAIIKASVDIEVKVIAQITFVSYQDIPISVMASVSVKLTVDINLGLFTISISVKFNADVKATFTIPNSADPSQIPWGAQDKASLLHARQNRRLRARMERFGGADALLGKPTPYSPKWSNLQAPEHAHKLQGYVAPALTAAGGLPDGDGGSRAAAAYVLTFFLGTQAPASGDTPRQVRNSLLANARDGDPSFKTLALLVTRWILAAAQTKPLTAEDLDQKVVSDDTLKGIIDYLNDPNELTPIPLDEIEALLKAQTEITFDLKTSKGQTPGVFFPVDPQLGIKVPKYGDRPELDYTIADYNATDSQFAHFLQAFFAQLAVMVEQEQKGTDPSLLAAGDTAGPSVGTYVFRDYFVLIGRQMMQALSRGLRDFQYTLNDDDTLDAITKHINARMVADGEDPGTLPADEKVTAAAILEANPDHPFNAGRTLQIRAARHSTAQPRSFKEIAALDAFKAPSGDPLFTAQALAAANADATGILRIAAKIKKSTNDETFTIQSSESLNSIAEREFGDVDGHPNLDALLTKTDLLEVAGLVPALTELTLPDFPHKTEDGDSANALADRYAITLDDLAEPDANLKVAGLFDATQDHSTLSVPHLPQYRIGDLIAEAVDTGAIDHLGGMASRYYLHGLRLPTQHVKPRSPGMYVRSDADGGPSLPAHMGLFALAGQQIEIPPLTDDKTFSFTLTAGAEWMKLRNEQEQQTEPGDTLTFKLSGDDKTRVTAVAKFLADQRLDTETSRLGPGPVSRDNPATYAFESMTRWRPAVPVDLPAQGATPEVPDFRIWSLAPSMAGLPGPARKVQPRFKVRIGRYLESTGQMSRRDVKAYGLGSAIRFAVKRIAPIADAPATQRTYEILGADTADVLLLERLLTGVSEDSQYFSMDLLFAAAGAGQNASLASYKQDRTYFGISQVNLSTVTRPPQSARLAARATGPGVDNVLNGPVRFLRLLWEASITRSGGFFLYYTAESEGAGLPEAIFNDEGEGHVTLLALFHAPSDDTPGAPLPAYANCFVTNAAVDDDRDQVYAEAVTREVSYPPAGEAVDTAPSLATLARQYFSDAAEVGLDNQTAQLTKGARLAIRNGLYQVRPAGEAPGGKLADIAQYFDTTVKALKAANTDGDDWPDPLPTLKGIKLPALTAEVGKAAQGDRTLQGIAAFYGISVAALAADNADVGGLLAMDGSLSLTVGPTVRSATMRPGTLSGQLERKHPKAIPDPDKPDFAALFLEHAYSLLGYQVVANADFADAATDGSGPALGLPVGPVEHNDTDKKLPKIRAVADSNPGDTWAYGQSVPYARLAKAKPKLPRTASVDAVSPYAGLGGVLQVDYAWHDYYGNQIPTHLSQPKSGDATPMNRPPAIPGYVDALVGITQWPGISADYRFEKGGAAGKVKLVLALSFDATSYDPDQTDDWKANAKHDIPTYTRIMHQLKDPHGLTLSLHTRVFPNATKTLALDGFAAFADGIEHFLQKRAEGDKTAQPPKPPVVELEYALDANGDDALNPKQIFELVTELTLARKRPDLVAGALRGTPGLAATTVTVKPMTGKLDANGDGTSRNLEAFAAKFKAALSTANGAQYHVAVGVDREMPPEAQNRQPVWAVRLETGDSPSTGIAFWPQPDSKPTIFAPRPLANKLVSRDAVIWPFDPEKGLQQADAHTRSYTDVDADQWLRRVLADIDALLSPRYVTPALVLDHKKGGSYLRDLLDQKKRLATALKPLMMQVFKEGGSSPDPQQAQEAFYQRMLGTLSEAYAVAAAVQYPIEVRADIGESGYETPRLYGGIVDRSADSAGSGGTDGDTGAGSGVSLSSPKLALKTTEPSEPAHLTFVVSTNAQAQPDRDTIALKPTYQGRNIEHQISNLPEVEGYQASAWLSFVDAPHGHGETKGKKKDEDKGWPLDQDLAPVAVPLILRSYPKVPNLPKQTYKSALEAGGDRNGQGGTLLDEAKRWDYSFTYALRRHRIQDRIHATVTFNVSDQAPAQSLLALDDEPDLFTALARFRGVWSDVVASLEKNLAPLTQSSATDQMDKAATALAASHKLIAWLASAAKANLNIEVDESRHDAALNVLQAMADGGGDPGPAGVHHAEPLKFVISETSKAVSKNGPGDAKEQVQALQVTLDLDPAHGGKLPAQMGTPRVDVPGYTAQLQTSGEADTRFVYLYVDADGNYLPFETGASIAERTVTLPGLDVLVRQDAVAAVFLRRGALYDGREANADFVYTTPEVEFPNALHPTVPIEREIRIDEIGPTPGAKRSLSDHLTTLFQSLFGDQALPRQIIQVTLFYRLPALPSETGDDVLLHEVPVFFQANQLLDLLGSDQTGDGISKAQLVQRLAKAYADWIKAYEPVGDHALLHFDVKVLSTLTRQPMPALHLANLVLPRDKIAE